MNDSRENDNEDDISIGDNNSILVLNCCTIHLKVLDNNVLRISGLFF